MSRFHHVVELEEMAAERFVEYVLRLPAYGGVLATAARREFAEEEPSMPPVAAIAANPSPQELLALNNTALYGPLQGEEVGLFNVRVIGGDSA